ncbi:nucleotidyltransferase family protein [Rhizobiaceae bacterium n13]|uniref:Nucleotidyltransferase family protein n=1 Tax=Ferirhizobium litorale TaxID=2927786 RepID=A0AAE3QBN8_9HYPH|nr:nucleotidyltransferase family protein [Fererhizobium litorale]MDI7860777.1 nucleotidyltransferase family protein [Fererhizobium litorale]MDI7920925.1 nucleotidyltransferase family protein [Fererhizobium litorale]
MRPSEVLEKNRQAIREATKRFNATNPRVFGSVAKGEDRPDSDLDILVDPLPGSTLLTLGGLQDALEQMMLGTSIHLLTPGDFPERVRASVLTEAKPI